MIYLTETIETDIGEVFIQRWMISPPPKELPYQVTKDEWTGDLDDIPIRTIYEIRLDPELPLYDDQSKGTP